MRCSSFVVVCSVGCPCRVTVALRTPIHVFESNQHMGSSFFVVDSFHIPAANLSRMTLSFMNWHKLKEMARVFKASTKWSIVSLSSRSLWKYCEPSIFHWYYQQNIPLSSVARSFRPSFLSDESGCIISRASFPGQRRIFDIRHSQRSENNHVSNVRSLYLSVYTQHSSPNRFWWDIFIGSRTDIENVLVIFVEHTSRCFFGSPKTVLSNVQSPFPILLFIQPVLVLDRHHSPQLVQMRMTKISFY